MVLGGYDPKVYCYWHGCLSQIEQHKYDKFWQTLNTVRIHCLKTKLHIITSPAKSFHSACFNHLATHFTWGGFFLRLRNCGGCQALCRKSLRVIQKLHTHSECAAGFCMSVHWMMKQLDKSIINCPKECSRNRKWCKINFKSSNQLIFLSGGGTF